MAINNIRDYIPNSADIFLFDSNIWVYLFDTNFFIPEYWEAKSIEIYSNFYKKILDSGAKIYITAFNIHEITKRFINMDRKAYELYINESTSYKTGYRQSDYYKNLLAYLKSINEKIFKSAIPVSDNFENFDKSLFFNAGIDFIDEYLSFMSYKSNCILVTHDRDFKNCPFNINILTDNKKLLHV